MRTIKQKTIKYKTNKGTINISPEMAARIKRTVLPKEAYTKKAKRA